MSLRDAFRLLQARLDDQPAVWLVGLAFGLVLGASYALLFVLDAPFGTPVAYAAFVFLIAPLFGGALWPYLDGEPPGSVRDLPRLAVRNYPRLLAARLGYVGLLVAFALALAAIPTVLGTLASLLNYLLGGGVTTLSPDRAAEIAALTVGVLALAGLAAARVVFGFLDVAALEGELRTAPARAFETALRAPGRTVGGVLALLPYRLGLPAVAFAVSGVASDTRGAIDVFTSSPRLAVVPGSAPSYATPPDPSLAPELLAGLVLADVLLTTFVWPVAFGYHATLFETLRESDGSDTANAPTTDGDAAGQ